MRQNIQNAMQTSKAFTVPQRAVLELLYLTGSEPVWLISHKLKNVGKSYMTISAVEMAVAQLKSRKLVRCTRRDLTRRENFEYQLTRAGTQLIRDLV